MQWSGRPLAMMCLLMALLQAAVLYTTFGVALGDIPDEGTIALQALRVAQGQIPHRDYFLQTPLASDVWVGLWFRLFGSSLESLRAYFFLEMALMAALIELLSTRLLPRRWSEIPALWFLCHYPFGWYIASARWDGAFWILAALVSLRDTRWRLVTGVLVGLAALTQHTAGAAAFAAVTVAVTAQAGPWKSKLQELRWFAWGVVLVWFPFVLFLFAYDSVSLFFYDTIFFNLTSYAQAHRMSIQWWLLLDNFRAALAVYQNSGDLLTFFLLLGYAIVDLGTFGLWFPLTAVGTARALFLRDCDQLALALTLAFLTLLELVRPNHYHFNFHSPLVVILWVVLARAGRGPGKLALALLSVGHVLVLAGHLQSSQFCNQVVGMPKGVLHLRGPERAEALREIVRVNHQIPPQEKLFVFPDDPLLQWLLGRPPVTREVAAFPCFYTYDQFQAIRQALKEEGVENLLYVPMNFDFRAYPGISEAQHHREETWLLLYLTQGYHPYRKVAGLTFYRRDGLADPGKP
ncbi:hypothetical protein IV102_38430 [bacterium]|nr:hypothetical protein [bacterium]